MNKVKKNFIYLFWCSEEAEEEENNDDDDDDNDELEGEQVFANPICYGKFNYSPEKLVRQ